MIQPCGTCLTVRMDPQAALYVASQLSIRARNGTAQAVVDVE
jgi:hypothetical protein